MNLLFMGTESFALEILKGICENTTHSVSVVTQPDKPRGRGHKLQLDCVKSYAISRELPVYQPESLKQEHFGELLMQLAPDIIVVASYGKILPEYVLQAPPMGCVNVHASLLPLYRGAAPIQRAILDGRTETGVTLMYMAKGLDTGDMICSSSVQIGQMNAGELRQALASEGARLLGDNLDKLLCEKQPATPQDHSLATYADKITKEDCPLYFEKTAQEVVCQIRALSPAPGASCTVASSGLTLKILDAEALYDDKWDEYACGELIEPIGFKKNTLLVRCGQGAIRLKIVQPDGGKAMDAASLANGRKLNYPDTLL